MRRLMIGGVAAALLLAAGAVQAGNAERGKGLAAACVACHGAQGISAIPMYPNLAGQHQMYLVNALKAYRDGKRPDPVMAPQAATLSDQAIADLAAYFASLPR
jgi:cytochrome c553